MSERNKSDKLGNHYPPEKRDAYEELINLLAEIAIKQHTGKK